MSSVLLGFVIGLPCAGLFIAGFYCGRSYAREEAESDAFWLRRGEPTMREWKDPVG